MPPSDDESSGGEIPSRKELKKRSAAKQVQEELDEAQDEDDEPEYVIEKVVGHKFKKNGELELRVKWKGYPEEENTWEPEAGSVNDTKQLDDYYEQMGGRPHKDSKTPARSDSKKRKLSKSAADTPTASGSASRGAKKSKADTSTNGGDIKLAKRDSFKPPSGSWEDQIISIDTMEIGPDNQLYAYIQWKTGERSQHRNTVVNQKCPQKMLQFYESHLQFNDTTKQTSQKYVAGPADGGDLKAEKAEPQAGNGAADEVGDEIDDDEEMGGVKGVATAV